MKQNGCALKYASNELLGDHEFILAAVKQNGCALQYASKELQSDREIVLAALASFGGALQFADHSLRCDRGAVLAAMLQDESALRYADESLQSDQRLLCEASERHAVARHASVDARFTLDPSWDADTAANFVSERFAATGKLACGKRRPCASRGFFCPLFGYRITSIELLSSAACAAATSALSRMWESRPRNINSVMSSEQLAVQRVFDELLRESGGDSLILYHGCSASAARSIAEQCRRSGRPLRGFASLRSAALPSSIFLLLF